MCMWPVIDLTATGTRIAHLRRSAGLSVRDLQDISIEFTVLIVVCHSLLCFCPDITGDHDLPPFFFHHHDKALFVLRTAFV